MTFIDNQSKIPSVVEICLFSVLAFISLICCYIAFRRCNKQSHYKSLYSVRLLLPFVCLLSAIENTALAISGHFIKSGNADNAGLKTIFVLTSFEIPCMLIVVFELSYLIHKRRSVYFCGIFFDEGRRVRQSQDGLLTSYLMSFLARNFIRCLALCLLVMSIIVNLDLTKSLSESEHVGKTGWYALCRGTWNKQKTEILISLIPTVVFSICCLYMTVALVLYGRESAMVLKSSILLNRWWFPLIGILFLIAGQCFSSAWFPITSNLGFLIFICTIISILWDIDNDLHSLQIFSTFLREVEVKGDEIGTKHIKPSHLHDVTDENKNGDNENISLSKFFSSFFTNKN
mmetsp:Transcript_6434/g.9350  ORF Transcript_6434/g.9350 Transcript_6434/m.9350 type:complete len:345 (+) Transcript_6434:168-1202(+)